MLSIKGQKACAPVTLNNHVSMFFGEKSICNFRCTTQNEISWHKISNLMPQKLNESRYIMNGINAHLEGVYFKTQIKYLI